MCLRVFVCEHVQLGYLSTSDTEKLLPHIKMQIFLSFFHSIARRFLSHSAQTRSEDQPAFFVVFFGMSSAFTVLLYFTLLCLRRSCGKSKFCHVSNRTKHGECLPGMLRAVTAVSVFYYHHYYYDFFYFFLSRHWRAADAEPPVYCCPTTRRLRSETVLSHLGAGAAAALMCSMAAFRL